MKQMRMHLARLCAPAAGLVLLAATPTITFADAPTGAPVSAGKTDEANCKIRLVGRPPYKRNLLMCEDAPAAKPLADAESDQCMAEITKHRGHTPYKRDCTQLAD